MRPAPPGFGASGSPQRGCECWRGCGDRGMPAPRSWWVPLPVGALVPRELCLHRGCATHPELPAFIPAVLQSPWTPSSGHQCVPAGLAGAMGREQGSSLPSPHKLAAAEGRQDPACCMLPCASDIPVCPSSGRDIPVPFPSWGGRRSVQSSPCNSLEHCTCAEPHGTVLALPAPASPPRPQGCDPLPRGGQGTLPPPASPASLLFKGREGAPPALRAPSLCTGTLHGHPMRDTAVRGCPPLPTRRPALPAVLADELTCSARLTVKPSVQPLFTRKLEDVDVVEGRTARFDCMVSGTPPPAVTWTHFGNPRAHSPLKPPTAQGRGC